MPTLYTCRSWPFSSSSTTLRKPSVSFLRSQDMHLSLYPSFDLRLYNSYTMQLWHFRYYLYRLNDPEKLNSHISSILLIMVPSLKICYRCVRISYRGKYLGRPCQSLFYQLSSHLCSKLHQAGTYLIIFHKQNQVA